MLITSNRLFPLWYYLMTTWVIVTSRDLAHCVHMNFIKRALTIKISISVLFFKNSKSWSFFTIASFRRAYMSFLFSMHTKETTNNEALSFETETYQVSQDKNIFEYTIYFTSSLTSFWESNKAMILQLHIISAVWHDFKLILSHWAFHLWDAPHKHNKSANGLRTRWLILFYVNRGQQQLRWRFTYYYAS